MLQRWRRKKLPRLKSIEEVVTTLQQASQYPLDRIDLSARKLKLLPEEFENIQASIGCGKDLYIDGVKEERAIDFSSCQNLACQNLGLTSAIIEPYVPHPSIAKTSNHRTIEMTDLIPSFLSQVDVSVLQELPEELGAQ
ncbi:unnamed protein product [Arabidopsis halleri]